ncbi:hypothetical protein BRC90_03665 [Halobacteriales archaeon QS_4_69_34]|jgi:hypothetical protein|nr:MAG: hypothetical protein BRC90_03665 [Halobacteriales archaeon QS_4_69_34]
MATTERSQSESMQGELTEVDSEASDVIALAAGLSVLLSLYEFYVRDNRDRGIFVGHWAPTILAFATYLRERRRDQ